MNNKLKLLMCGLLMCAVVPINFAFAAISIISSDVPAGNMDRDGDGIHIDDIVYYLSHTGALSTSDEVRNLLNQIAPISFTAGDVAAGITSVTAPAADVTSLTLPTVPAGYTIAISFSSDTGVIGTNGRIVPPQIAASVNLMFTVTRSSDSSTANTSSIAVTVPAHVLTAGEVAAGITNVTPPEAGATSLIMPTVPSGYTIAINSSNKTAIVGTNGAIAPPSASTSVDLTFTITRISDSSAANTTTLTVAIPASQPVFIPRPVSSINVALAGIATASSTAGGGFLASGVINGNRSGSNWGSGDGWNDGTPSIYPDWVQVDFNGNQNQTINEIDVVTLRDDFNVVSSEPTISTTFIKYGISDYIVQYWKSDVNDWVTVTNGSVINNNYVWRQFTFSPVVTDKIRLTITRVVDIYSRVVELEAWTPGTAP